MAVTQTQRILDLAYGGHPPSEIANLLSVSENTVRSALQTLANAATGQAAPASIDQRIVDLAYSGHPVPQIANLTGQDENHVRGVLQDLTKTQSQAESTLNGTTQTTAPAAGGAAALPATPTGYVTVRVNGTDRRIAYY